MTTFYCLFSSELGSCGIAWNENGIVRSYLPEKSDSALERLFLKRAYLKSKKVPLKIQKEIKKIQSHLSGTRVSYDVSMLSFEEMTPFQQKVLKRACKIPAGKVLSYGELARLVGSPKAARAVGTALAKNPFPLIIPCHRILAAKGLAGGFSAYGGLDTKKALLRLEGYEL